MTAAAGLQAGSPATADTAGDATAANCTTMTAAARWAKLFGCPAPQRLPSLVEQAVAWREQVLACGDVSSGIAHDLRLAVEHALQQRGIAPSGGQPAAIVHDIAAVEPRQTIGDEDAIRGEKSFAGDDKPVSPGPARSVVATSLRGPAIPAQSATQRGRAAPLPPAASQLLPGSQLVKAYGGRNHVVTVEAPGFRYEGELFTSLSAVAKHITGTHWNGLLFFGLRKRRTYPPKPRRHG